MCVCVRVHVRQGGGLRIRPQRPEGERPKPSGRDRKSRILRRSAMEVAAGGRALRGSRENLWSQIPQRGKQQMDSLFALVCANKISAPDLCVYAHAGVQIH